MGYEFNPNKVAFTGGVGKPTKKRANDGRPTPPSKMGVQYAASGASPLRVRSSTVTKVSGIYGRLAPYANNNPPKPVLRAPKGMFPWERKRWRIMMKKKQAGL